ncbi:MAG: hypothetical protein COA74_02035 [Gammaproteobacteria bacterium]|nr:MAG: hypothetical protein COA74_02035 [Gammaproteobacteria bacterium]
MKFIIGEIPKNIHHDFKEFIRLKEPEKSKFMYIASFIQVALWGVFFFVWWMIDGNTPKYFFQTGFIGYALILLIVFPVHELFHGMIYPIKDSKKIMFGFWPKMGAFYAMYDGALTRNRWLLVYVMPFFLISVIPMFVALYTTVPSWLVIASILNAGFAAGDIAAITMIAYQVPKQAIIVQNGWDTYWRSTVNKSTKQEK